MRPSFVKLLFSSLAIQLDLSFLWFVEPLASRYVTLLFAANGLLSVLDGQLVDLAPEVSIANGFGNRKCVHFKTKKEAEGFLDTVQAQTLRLKEGLLPEWFGNGKKNNLTVGDLYDIYLEKKIGLKEKASAQRAAKKILNGFLKAFGKIKVSELTINQIDDHRIRWLKAGKKRSSFQNQLNSFKTMLIWGVKHGHISRNPLNQYETEKAKAEEKEALHDDLIRRFILGLKDRRPNILDYLILGINTGMRIAELCSLEWNQVDIEKRTLYLPAEKTKTSHARTVPLNNACMDVINRLYEKKEYAPYVLWHPLRADMVTKEVGKLSKRFLGKKHTPHYWRVTFATRALRGRRIEGKDGRVYWVRGDLKTVAEIGGWEANSKILVSIYQKVSEEQKRETVDLVGIGEADILPVAETCQYTDSEARKLLIHN